MKETKDHGFIVVLYREQESSTTLWCEYHSLAQQTLLYHLNKTEPEFKSGYVCAILQKGERD